MAFETYTEIEAGRAEVSAIIARQRRRLDSLKGEFSSIVTELTAAATEYGPLIAAIDALLLASPTDVTYIAKKGEINKHLSDFNALNAEAGALDALVNT